MADHDFPTALQTLLDVWRTNPAPSIGDAIDALSRHVGAATLDGSTPVELVRAWNRLEKAATRRISISCSTTSAPVPTSMA